MPAVVRCVINYKFPIIIILVLYRIVPHATRKSHTIHSWHAQLHILVISLDTTHTTAVGVVVVIVDWTDVWGTHPTPTVTTILCVGIASVEYYKRSIISISIIISIDPIPVTFPVVVVVASDWDFWITNQLNSTLNSTPVHIVHFQTAEILSQSSIG